jgi:TonB family protein
MLQTLIYSQPVRASGFASTAFSTLAHGALIAAAIASTSHPGQIAHEHGEVLEQHVTYVKPELLTAARLSKHGAGPVVAKQPAFVLPNLADAQDAIDSSIPLPTTTEPDLSVVTDQWLVQPDALSTAQSGLVDAIGARSVAPPPVNGVYSQENVDRMVSPRPGNPTPRYPGVLQDMRIEGEFVVKFVVDSTGAVEPDRIEFPSAMHRLFAESVRNALLRSRYFPAQIAGRFVPQMVIQEFRFTMAR